MIEKFIEEFFGTVKVGADSFSTGLGDIIPIGIFIMVIWFVIIRIFVLIEKIKERGKNETQKHDVN